MFLGTGFLAHGLCQLEAKVHGVTHRFFVFVQKRKGHRGFPVRNHEFAACCDSFQHGVGLGRRERQAANDDASQQVFPT